MKKSLVIFLVLMMTTTLGWAQSSDSPEPDESFATFFARITRGAQFPGIYVTPPQEIQDSFLKTIKSGYWVGLRTQVQRKLKAQNVDLWGQWYKETHTFPLIFNSPEKQSVFLSALQNQIAQDQNQCAPACPQSAAILTQEWKQLDTFSKQAFVKAYIFSSPLFAGRTLIDYLSDVYQFPTKDVLSTTEIRILSDKDFIQAVRETGYDGPIYFRGITAPHPKIPSGHLILLNAEKIASGSPFDAPLLQTLELVGILTHELSHVFQDLKGHALGSDVQVRSAEAALLIEGSAEYLAEEAMTRAALQEKAPSALELFVSEQAVEIVNRPGNESTGQLFPYTVGLPFSAALYNQQGPDRHEALTEKILQYLGARSSFNDWLAGLLK